MKMHYFQLWIFDFHFQLSAISARLIHLPIMPTYSFHFLCFHVSPAHFLIKEVAYQSSMFVESQSSTIPSYSFFFKVFITKISFNKENDQNSLFFFNFENLKFIFYFFKFKTLSSKPHPLTLNSQSILVNPRV